MAKTKKIKIGKNEYKAFKTNIEDGCSKCVFNKRWKYCDIAGKLSNIDCVQGYSWEKIK